MFTCLFHLHLMLGLELSPQLFHASSVPQDPSYTFSHEGSTINSHGFFNAIFPLLLPSDKSHPSTEYLQHREQIPGTITKTSSGLGTALPLQTRTLSVPLDSNRQSYSRTNTTRTKEQGFESAESAWKKHAIFIFFFYLENRT